MQLKAIKRSSTALAMLLLSGCSSTEDAVNDPNSAAKRGAAGGALIGLTLGALTGDADLAMRGAIAGGVSGGVAGSMEDLNSGREDNRTQTLAGAISGDTDSAAKTWPVAEQLAGNWNIQIWSLQENETITSTASGTGFRQSDSAAQLSWYLQDSKTEPVSGQVSLSYSPEQGFQLISSASNLTTPLVFSGEKITDQHYRFYPINSTSAAPQYLDLKAVSSNYWHVEGFLMEDGQQKLVQTFRFTRT